MFLSFNRDMLSKTATFVKSHFNDIMLFIIVLLLILFSFAAGYITAKYQTKTPIQIIQKQ